MSPNPKHDNNPAPQAITNIGDLGEEDESRYLIFYLEHEIYGTPLLGVREVLEVLAAKPIPNTAAHFKGLINIRGQIIGVVDLRMRFGYPVKPHPGNAMLVFETEAGPIATIVDKVEAVVKIDESHLHRKPNIRSHVPIDYLIGASTYKGGIVTLIDLNQTLSKEDYVEINQAKMNKTAS